MTVSSLTIDSQQGNHSNEELLLDAYQDYTSNEMLEKMWNFGKYLLISASTEGGNPCHLYGLWCGEYRGQWAFNMVNENLQMIYWQALSGNMPELLLPVFDYVDRLMDDFRTNAKNLYGCRGIYIPGPSVPDSGLVKHLSPHILYWTGGAGWVGQHYYDYFLCTQDMEFLKKRALPYLKEVALFYEDFFVEDKDGYYMTIPSNSPENSPGNFWDGKDGMGCIMETTMNATMDFAIAKEVFTHLIEGYKILEILDEDVNKWKTMLNKIPDYEINEDGAVKEWMHEFFEDNYRHRHQSHLYPLFPGNEIHKGEDDRLYDAFVKAVKKRLQIGINQQTGWSLAHMANNYARMQESELAIECLDMMCRSGVMNNFLTLHNDWRSMGIGVKMNWAPVQVDANMGFSAAINEMLLQSYKDKILILPALARRLKKGKVENLLTRQGIEVTIGWDMEEKVIEVILKNGSKPQTVELILPDYCRSSIGKLIEKRNYKLDKQEVKVMIFTCERKDYE
jgi:alpha-L-fucosidase 2